MASFTKKNKENSTPAGEADHCWEDTFVPCNTNCFQGETKNVSDKFIFRTIASPVAISSLFSKADW